MRVVRLLEDENGASVSHYVENDRIVFSFLDDAGVIREALCTGERADRIAKAILSRKGAAA